MKHIANLQKRKCIVLMVSLSSPLLLKGANFFGTGLVLRVGNVHMDRSIVIRWCNELDGDTPINTMLLRFWRLAICFMASSSNSSRSSSRQRFRRSWANVSFVPIGFISKICRIVMKSSRSHISHNSATTYRQVFKRFLKISLWSTYFVYVRTPKNRGLSEIFDFRFLDDIFRIFSML